MAFLSPLKSFFLALFCVLALAACETSSYHAASSNTSFGYTEAELEEGRWRVTFRARDINTAYDFALYRAAEITRAMGYDWFRVVNSFANEDERYDSSGVVVGGHTGSHHRSGVGVGIGFPLNGGDRVATQTLEIVMGKGEKPEGDQVYDAASVLAKIGPRAKPAS